MKKVRTYLLLLAVFLVCSYTTTSFIYNNVDWLAYIYLDDYVELDSNQKELLDKSIKQLHSWHRSTELKKYRSDLISLAKQLESGGLNREQWLDEFSKVQQHLHNFRDEVSPEAIKLIQQLSDKQIKQLLVMWLENDNDELEEFAAQEAAAEIKIRQEKITDVLEKNTGRLSSHQKGIVKRYSEQIESTLVEEIAYGNKLRTALEKLLVERNTSEFPDKFNYLIKNLDSFKSQKLMTTKRKNEYIYAELLSELTVSLNKKQSDKLLKTLKSHIETIDSLIE